MIPSDQYKAILAALPTGIAGDDRTNLAVLLANAGGKVVQHKSQSLIQADLARVAAQLGMSVEQVKENLGPDGYIGGIAAAGAA